MESSFLGRKVPENSEKKFGNDKLQNDWKQT